ncbi:MAG: thioredoxin [Bacillota bacterium]|nr:thioredoxin [Bacillota bacterium]
MSLVREVSDSNFVAEVLESALPVLVDFWATWCGPCRAVAAVVEQLADEFRGALKVCKLDVDESHATARECGVISLPTLIVFRNGEPVQRLVGSVPRIAELRARVNGVLS